jgi:hypothetical protein
MMTTTEYDTCGGGRYAGVGRKICLRLKTDHSMHYDPETTCSAVDHPVNSERHRVADDGVVAAGSFSIIVQGN